MDLTKLTPQYLADLIIDNGEGGAQLVIADAVLRESLRLSAEKQIQRLHDAFAAELSRLTSERDRDRIRARTEINRLLDVCDGYKSRLLTIKKETVEECAKEIELKVQELSEALKVNSKFGYDDEGRTEARLGALREALAAIRSLAASIEPQVPIAHGSEEDK